MLNDTLGTIVAFLTVILLLSMLVTGLVQATQAMLGLRGRNLLRGIAKLIANELQAAEDAKDKKVTGRATPAPKLAPNLAEKDGNPKQKAREILNRPDIGLLYSRDLTSRWGKVWRILRGPGISWVDPDDLVDCLYAVPSAAAQTEPTESAARASSGTQGGPVDSSAAATGGMASTTGTNAESEERKKAKRKVAALGNQVSKKFELQMRGLSLAWGFAVAVAFQVSTPQLLTELARDSVRRDQILTQTSGALGREQEALRAVSYEYGAADAISRLSERYPAVASQLEELSGVGTNKEFQVDELRLVLKDEPMREEIVRAYGELLDAAADKYAENLGRELKLTTSALRGIGIEVWKDPTFFGRGWKEPNLRAIVGVLLTAILLSFGAPFWFKVLREAAALRDRLVPKPSVPSTEESDSSSTKKSGRETEKNKN